MRVSTLFLAFPALVVLAGCVAVPYYPPAPIVRMTPQQSAAAVRPLDPAERERLSKLNAEVQREQDAADAREAEQQRAAALARSYAYSSPWYGGYDAYPGYYPRSYYPGFYPYWPGGISLSFGYIHGGGWGHPGWGHGGWGGGGGHGGWGGGGGHGGWGGGGGHGGWGGGGGGGHHR